MNIITKPSEIDNILVELIGKYSNYQIATAWASIGSKASLELLKNKDKIQKMVVGTHFYQTHPDFISKFIDSQKVKFILNTNGIYHPKTYLFFNNENEWECIIGSANFTNAALSKNNEIVIHIKNSDSDSREVFSSLVEVMETYWVLSESMSQADYDRYKNIWKEKQAKIKVLSGEYGKTINSKPLVKSDIFSREWISFFKRIKNDKFHSFDGRIKLLKTSREYFKSASNFAELSELQRKEVAGIANPNPSQSDIDWKWFGSMSGAGKFQQQINNNNPFISKALDSIPLRGKVYKQDYESYVSQFKKAFPDGGAGIAIASRLLAMKRPDCFICLDSKNKKKLCEDFGISQSSINFDSYWDDIVERIQDSVWYLSEKPKDEEELDAWNSRVAMLDSIFYEE